jgi:K+-transporting ATPase ATPase C chain
MSLLNSANPKVAGVIEVESPRAQTQERSGQPPVKANDKTRRGNHLKKNLFIAISFTLVTTVIFGLLYPLAITGLAHVMFPDKASGQLIEHNGKLVGSRIIGQTFTSPAYFHGRPSTAGTGYDPQASGGSNLGPTNKNLIERVKADVAKLQSENPGVPVPIDLVTSSASGLDPEISPAAAQFQIPRIARERAIPQQELQALVQKHTQSRDLGFLGETRVNVLALNLDLDALHPAR